MISCVYVCVCVCVWTCVCMVGMRKEAQPRACFGGVLYAEASVGIGQVSINDGMSRA